MAVNFSLQPLAAAMQAISRLTPPKALLSLAVTPPTLPRQVRLANEGRNSDDLVATTLQRVACLLDFRSRKRGNLKFNYRGVDC
jgi:hypothetical protein